MKKIKSIQNQLIYILLLTFLSFNTIAQSKVEKILIGAYNEIENNTKYNTTMLNTYFSPTYKNGNNTGKAVFPNGDVNPKEGICADLIVRTLRYANIDLQQLVYQDVTSNKKQYGVKTPDKYIDQRRVWILKTFFKRSRKWKKLTTKLKTPIDWQAGDIVIWDIGSKVNKHIGIIGKKKRSDGYPYVIHNMRYFFPIFKGKTIEQDIIEGPPFVGWKIIGHYRLKEI